MVHPMERKNYIIGGGLSGLSSSYFLRKDKNTIIEKQERLDGRIRSLSVGDDVIEIGAQFFSEGDLNLYSLIQDLNLENDLRKASLPDISIHHEGRSLKLKDRLSKELEDDEKTELKRFYSFIEKLDEDFFQNPPENILFENFDNWYRENIGKKTVWFISSLVRAITFSTPKEISAFFGLVVCITFFEPCYSIQGGLGYLNKRLLSSSRPKIIKNTKITGLTLKGGGIREMIPEGGKPITVNDNDRVISSVPAQIIGEWLPKSELKELLDKIKYKGCGVTLLEASKSPLENSSGVLYPDEKGISAIIDQGRFFGFDSENKYILVLRPFEGDEDDIFEKGMEELREIAPDWERHIKSRDYFEWNYALPVASPRFFKYQREIETSNKIENLYLCGDYMGLPSLDACVKSARSVAEKVKSN